MNIATLVRLSAAACLGAGGVAGAQCTWMPHAGGGENVDGVMVYDSVRQRVLFIQTPIDYVKIFAWDGSHWSQVNTPGPLRCSGVAAAFDSARGRLVMYGGFVYSGIGLTNVTWEWDGFTWTLPALGPQAREEAAMVYDQARQKTVMFGGTGNGTLFGDTWEWDGETWTAAATTGPSARTHPSMAYDSVRQRTVLCGGYAAQGEVMDVWEWGGGAWSQRATVNQPGPAASWMVFDPGRARMVLGRSTGIYPNYWSETWELDPAGGLWSLHDPGTAPLGPCVFDPLRSRVMSWGKDYDGLALSSPVSIVQHPVGGSFVTHAAVTLHVGAVGTQPMTYRWIRNGVPLSDGGNISGSGTDTLVINPAIVSDGGTYQVQIDNACGSVTDWVGVSLNPACYANCDDSTTPPILNANDFQCFLNAYAAGQSYANCDGAMSTPILTANDFQCFLNRFAAGCS